MVLCLSLVLLTVHVPRSVSIAIASPCYDILQYWKIARKVLPCFDEPHFKASFQLRIGHASAMKAISNMPVESSAQM